MDQSNLEDDFQSDNPDDSQQSPSTDDAGERAMELVEQHIRETPEDEPIDACRFLAEHPEVGRFHSCVIDLAHEEYCRRRELGEDFDPIDFANKFPKDVQDSLLEMVGFREFGGDLFWPKKGERFLHFELMEELGRGGIGRVFLARNSNLDRLEVLKICPKETHEGKTLARLKHRNIVEVLDGHPNASVNFFGISMLYVSRATLMDVWRDHCVEDTASVPQSASSILKTIRDRNADGEFADDHSFALIPEKNSFADGIVRIGLHVAEALEYSHSKGICHGDIKPSNILLTRGGRPMLLDFNLSFRDSTMQDGIGATLLYAAPEQLAVYSAGSRDLSLAASARLDGRVDIYSLGVTLYQMLTGRLPYGSQLPAGSPRETAILLLKQRKNQRIVGIQQLNPAVDRELAELVEQCLSLSPHKRPQTAAVLADKLAGLLGRVQQVKRTVRNLGKWSLSHQIATVVAVVLLAAAGVMAVSRTPAERGFEAQFDGKHQLAIQCFLGAEQTPEVRFAAARSQLALGLGQRDTRLLTLTLADLEQLSLETKDGRVTAMAAYCRSLIIVRTGRYKREDIQRLKNTIMRARREGFNPSANEINLGFCFLLADLKDASGLATPCLEKAETKADHIAADRLLAMSYATGTLRNRKDPRSYERVFAKLESEMKLGGRTPENVVLGIILHSAAGWFLQDVDAAVAADHKETTLSLWREALELGVDPKQIFDEHDLFSKYLFKNDPRFAAVLKTTKPHYRLGLLHLVVNPLPDFKIPIDM